jgi:transcriptional regulator with XRE-family HTH domain
LDMRSDEHDRLYRMIGDRIREARERKNLRQSALAAKLKLSRVSIVNIEKGRQRPPLHVIWQIAEELGIEPYSIIPRQREFLDAGDGVHLDPDTVAQIEAAAKGDPATQRRLTEFIRMAKATGQRSR